MKRGPGRTGGGGGGGIGVVREAKERTVGGSLKKRGKAGETGRRITKEKT